MTQGYSRVSALEKLLCFKAFISARLIASRLRICVTLTASKGSGMSSIARTAPAYCAMTLSRSSPVTAQRRASRISLAQALLSGEVVALGGASLGLSPSDNTDKTDETSPGWGFVGSVSFVRASPPLRAASSHRVMACPCEAPGSRHRAVGACRPAGLMGPRQAGCTRHLPTAQVPGRGRPCSPDRGGRAASPAAH